MSLPEISVKRPVLSIVMSLLIMIFGFIGMSFLGVREFPSIDPPVITVRTNYSGANAEVIESQITEPLEKALNSIEGIRTISSASNQGSSVITIEFEISNDLEKAANDVRDKVSQAVRQLPQDIDAVPSVSKADANSDAIISMTVRSKDRNPTDLSDYAENVLAERLQTIPGVSSLQIWGQKRYAMRLWLNPEKMAALGITPVDVKRALEQQNIELPGGKIEGNNSELNINTQGKLKTPAQFENLILKQTESGIVRFRDIGRSEIGAENETTILRQSGVPMIGLAIVPQPGANYINIADEFYKRFELLKKEAPDDLELDIVLDNTEFVRKSLVEVAETIGIAFLLVIIVIFLFFRDWLVALRPLIDIPVSLVGSFFVMYVFGYSINVLTLLAIVLATGLVVDDGIVVTENIFKRIEKGENPVKASIEGSKEIMFAVISTTLTLAAVFLPVMFLQGFTGRLFREFAVVMASSVLISAFVSLSLTPMLNAYLVRKNKVHTRFFLATEPFFESINTGYRSWLSGILRKKYLSVAILLLSAVFSWILYGSLQKELAPLDDRSWFRLSITGPENASYEYTDRFLMNLAQFIDDSVPEKAVALTVTSPQFAGSGSVNTGFLRLKLTDPDKRKRTQAEVAAYIQKKSALFTDARTFVIQPQTISTGGPGFGQPVQFVIQAPDFEKLKSVLPGFMDEASKDPALQSVDVNLKFNKPELNVTINREKASEAGVSVQDIAQTLQLAFSAQRLSYFNLSGRQYQVIGQFDRQNRDEPSDLAGIYVRSNTGRLIQLQNLIEIKEESSPPQRYRYNRYVSATVSAGLAPGKTVGDGIQAMRKIAAKKLDPSFSTSLAGTSRDFAESSSNLMMTFVLSLIFIYLLLAAQFESFADPLIIMLTVPLAVAGALFSLWYFNETLNIFSQIGVIMLIGLVTKNGILIVEFANQLREQGKEKFDAILEASVMRLRPILMTSIATFFGALPIAMAFGSGVKSRQGMGIVVLGGVAIGLLFTLLVIPTMYLILARKKRRVAA
jgi:multidrug efflux pump